jgi:predicted ribosome-associated RNA-binding protein Tma20
MRDPFVLRDKAAVERFMDGLDVMEPGLVTVDQWTPHGKVREVDGPVTPFYAAVAHKVTDDRAPARSRRRGGAASSTAAGAGAPQAPRKVATTRLHRDSTVGVAR